MPKHKLLNVALKTGALLICVTCAIAEQSSPTSAAEAAPRIETVRGYLMPFKCQFDEKKTHSRDCALRPECRVTGFGLALDDGTFLQFDTDGNKQAVRVLERTTKKNDLQIEAEGYRVGPLFHPRAIRLT